MGASQRWHCAGSASRSCHCWAPPPTRWTRLSLDLTGRNGDAAGLFQMPFGFEVGLLVGSFQADELGQGRSVADFQPQGVIGRVMALLFTCVVIVIAAQRGTAKNPLHPNDLPVGANLAGFGLVAGINALGCLPEQPADHGIGRLENGDAHQDLQFGHGAATRGLGLKISD